MQRVGDRGLIRTGGKVVDSEWCEMCWLSAVMGVDRGGLRGEASSCGEPMGVRTADAKQPQASSPSINRRLAITCIHPSTGNLDGIGPFHALRSLHMCAEYGLHTRRGEGGEQMDFVSRDRQSVRKASQCTDYAMGPQYPAATWIDTTTHAQHGRMYLHVLGMVCSVHTLSLHNAACAGISLHIKAG